jgi:hypothetical protein
MSSQQVFDIYPVCQKFLLDFGYSQDGDRFTLQNEDGKTWFDFSSEVTVDSLNNFCYQVAEVLDDSDEPQSTKDNVLLFDQFISSIQHLFKTPRDYNMLVNYKSLVNTRQELKELKDSIKNYKSCSKKFAELCENFPPFVEKSE